MNIPVIDGSNYFKGLLLLIRRDNRISKAEREIMTRIGRTLGFEEKFIENAIDEIIDNRHINTEPPVFSNREIAEKFLKDGLTLAASDNSIHPHEEAWLQSVAAINNINGEWLLTEKKTILHNLHHERKLEADSIKVAY